MKLFLKKILFLYSFFNACSLFCFYEFITETQCGFYSSHSSYDTLYRKLFKIWKGADCMLSLQTAIPSNDNSHLLMIKDAIEATKSMLDIETISNDEINSLSSILVQLKDNTVIQYNTQLFKIINFCHEYLEILPQISLAKI